jgi:hypothetical protein
LRETVQDGPRHRGANGDQNGKKSSNSNGFCSVPRFGMAVALSLAEPPR